MMDEIVQVAAQLTRLLEEKANADAPTGWSRPKSPAVLKRKDHPVQYMLRLPNGMRDQLKEQASRNKRSLNAEIVGRLERSLAADALRRSTESREEAMIIGEILRVAAQLAHLIQERESAEAPRNESGLGRKT